MITYTAPESVPCAMNFVEAGIVTIFLAGSIEMGKAREWQAEVIEELSKWQMEKLFNESRWQVIAVFNPRRSNWDSSWGNSPDNPQLTEQIDWELEQLDKAGIVFLYLNAATMSPISLLELGREVKTGRGRMVVVCEPGFWREANVHRTCLREGVPVYKSLEEGMVALKELLS